MVKFVRDTTMMRDQRGLLPRLCFTLLMGILASGQTCLNQWPRLLGGMQGLTVFNCAQHYYKDWGTLIVTGHSESIPDVVFSQDDSQESIPFIAAYGRRGDLKWAKQVDFYDTSPSIHVERWNTCAINSQTDKFVAITNTGGFAIIVVNLVDGDLQHSFYLEETSNAGIALNDIAALDVKLSDSGKIFIAAEQQEKFILIKFDILDGLQLPNTYITNFGASDDWKDYKFVSSLQFQSETPQYLYVTGQRYLNPALFKFDALTGSNIDIVALEHTGDQLSARDLDHISVKETSTGVFTIMGCINMVGVQYKGVAFVKFTDNISNDLKATQSLVYEYTDAVLECLAVDQAEHSDAVSMLVTDPSATILLNIYNTDTGTTQLKTAKFLKNDGLPANFGVFVTNMQAAYTGQALSLKTVRNVLTDWTLEPEAGYISMTNSNECIESVWMDIPATWDDDLTDQLGEFQQLLSSVSLISLRYDHTDYNFKELTGVIYQDLVDTTVRPQADDCQVISTVSFEPPDIQDQNYTIGSGVMEVTYNPFVTQGSCSDILFEIEAYQTEPTLQANTPSWVDFRFQDNKFLIETNMAADVGLYKLQMRGKVVGTNQEVESDPFQVEIIAQNVQNQPEPVPQPEPIPQPEPEIQPELEPELAPDSKYVMPPNEGPKFTEELDSIIMFADSSKGYPLPPIENDASPNTKVTIRKSNSMPLPNFITYSQRKITLEPTPPYVGSYELKITLQDETYPKLKSEYSLLVDVKPEEEEKTEQGNQNNFEKQQELCRHNGNLIGCKTLRNNFKDSSLTAEITSVSRTGEVFVQFSESINEPQNYQSFNESVMNLGIKNEQETILHGGKDFDWTIKTIQNSAMIIQLNLQTPLEISTMQIRDQISIDFVRTELFTAKRGNRLLKTNLTISEAIPPQSGSLQEESTLESTGAAIESVLNTFLYSNLALNLVMATSIQTIWGMVNTLQLIVHLPLFGLVFPSNVIVFFSALINALNFNLVDLSNLHGKMYQLKRPEEYGPYNANFQQLNYISTNITHNLGLDFFVAFTLLPLMIVILALLFTVHQKAKIVHWMFKKLKSILLFGFILRLMIESYLMYFLCAMVQVMNIRTNTNGETFSVVVAFGLIIVLILAPIALPLFLLKNQNMLGVKDFKERYESSYDCLKTDLKLAVVYNAAFMIRRLLFCLTALFLIEYPSFQFFIYIVLSVASLSYKLSTRPFLGEKQNRMEQFNEWTILVVASTLPVFTDYVEGPAIKNGTGWFIISMVGLNFLVNIFLIMVETFRKMKLMVIKCIRKREARKRAPQLPKSQPKMSQVSKAPNLNVINEDSKEELETIGLYEKKSKFIKNTENKTAHFEISLPEEFKEPENEDTSRPILQDPYDNQINQNSGAIQNPYHSLSASQEFLASIPLSPTKSKISQYSPQRDLTSELKIEDVESQNEQQIETPSQQSSFTKNSHAELKYAINVVPQDQQSFHDKQRGSLNQFLSNAGKSSQVAGNRSQKLNRNSIPSPVQHRNKELGQWIDQNNKALKTLIGQSFGNKLARDDSSNASAFSNSQHSSH